MSLLQNFNYLHFTRRFQALQLPEPSWLRRSTLFYNRNCFCTFLSLLLWSLFEMHWYGLKLLQQTSEKIWSDLLIYRKKKISFKAIDETAKPTIMVESYNLSTWRSTALAEAFRVLVVQSERDSSRWLLGRLRMRCPLAFRAKPPRCVDRKVAVLFYRYRAESRGAWFDLLRICALSIVTVFSFCRVLYGKFFKPVKVRVRAFIMLAGLTIWYCLALHPNIILQSFQRYKRSSFFFSDVSFSSLEKGNRRKVDCYSRMQSCSERYILG